MVILQVMEDLIKTVTEDVIAKTEDEIDYFRSSERFDRDSLVNKLCKNRFER